MKNILFIDYWPEIDSVHFSGAGLGSSLFKLAAIADAKEMGFATTLLTSPLKCELLKDAFGIDDLVCKLPKGDFDKVIFLGVLDELIDADFEHIPYTFNDKKRYKTTAHLEFWRSFIANHLGYRVPKSPAKMQLALNETIKSKWQDKTGTGEWMAINVDSISRLKDYSHWQEVIDLLLALRPNLNIVALGGKTDLSFDGDRILNLSGKTSIEELKCIIHSMDALVGVDGLNTNIAMALKVKTVVLFSMIDPNNVIDPDSNSHVKVLTHTGCPYQFCYSELSNYRNGSCRQLEAGNGVQCLGLSAKLIANEVVGFL